MTCVLLNTMSLGERGGVVFFSKIGQTLNFIFESFKPFLAKIWSVKHYKSKVRS